MKSCEAFSRTRSLRQSGGSITHCLSRRDAAPRSGISKTGRCESKATRPKTEGQAFRFGPRGNCPLEGFRFFSHVAGKLVIREALADYLSAEVAKALCIVHG